MMVGGFFGVDQAKGHDDDEVAGLGQVCGGAHDTDAAGVGGCRDDIGFVPGAVGDVGDEDFLVGDEAGGLHEGAIDAEAAFVVELSLGDGGAVNFRMEYGNLHIIAS